ncbi:MAG TPA: hypothetical protein VF228_20615 [Iamia sp.]
MDPFWAFGLLLVAWVVAVAVQATVDVARDILAPYRPVLELPPAGPEAFTISGPVRRGSWSGGLVPGARITVTPDWIGIRQRTLDGVRCYQVDRDEVATVVVVAGLPMLGAGIGVRGPERTSRLAVFGSNRSAIELALDRLGWPHERRRSRLLRPFA